MWEVLEACHCATLQTIVVYGKRNEDMMMMIVNNTDFRGVIIAGYSDSLPAVNMGMACKIILVNVIVCGVYVIASGVSLLSD